MIARRQRDSERSRNPEDHRPDLPAGAFSSADGQKATGAIFKPRGTSKVRSDRITKQRRWAAGRHCGMFDLNHDGASIRLRAHQSSARVNHLLLMLLNCSFG
jgi:hypothetical protein